MAAIDLSANDRARDFTRRSAPPASPCVNPEYSPYLDRKISGVLFSVDPRPRGHSQPTERGINMELRDLLTLDVNTLSAVEAELASGDIVRVMTGGNVTGVDLQRLKTLLVEVNRKKLPPEGPDTRTRVKQLIAEAEARGDARTAHILAESLVKADATALENAERAQKAIEASNKYWADQQAAKPRSTGDGRNTSRPAPRNSCTPTATPTTTPRPRRGNRRPGRLWGDDHSKTSGNPHDQTERSRSSVSTRRRWSYGRLLQPATRQRPR